MYPCLLQNHLIFHPPDLVLVGAYHWDLRDSRTSIVQRGHSNSKPNNGQKKRGQICLVRRSFLMVRLKILKKGHFLLFILT